MTDAARRHDVGSGAPSSDLPDANEGCATQVDAHPDTVPVSAVDPSRLRSLLRCQASTVTVITMPGGPPAGFTATSFTSVSLQPPIVSFCVGLDSSVWLSVARARHVAVHLLADDQQALARTFAMSGVDRFADPTVWHAGPHGVPILAGTPAWLVCRVVRRLTAGDHSIVLAEPLIGRLSDRAAPLLYHEGRYTRLPPV